ncbi:hypothetical protein ACFLYO_05190, partial [Chloroflexota bacterium]
MRKMLWEASPEEVVSAFRPRWLWVIFVVSMLLALAILLDASSFLRGGFGWQWPYLPVAIGRVVPLLAV